MFMSYAKQIIRRVVLLLRTHTYAGAYPFTRTQISNNKKFSNRHQTDWVMPGTHWGK